MDLNEAVRDFLTKRDGSVSRGGKAMLALSKSTGYSVETLRSYAYGRRSPSQGPRLKKLQKRLSRG